MSRSTLILSLAIDCVSLTSGPDSCALLDRKAGMWTLQGTQSSTRKSLSTMVAIVDLRRDTMPDCFKVLSLMEPSLRDDTNVIAPITGHTNQPFESAV